MLARPDPNREEPLGPIIPTNRYLHKTPHLSEMPEFETNFRDLFTNEERRIVTSLTHRPETRFSCLPKPNMFRKTPHLDNGCPPFLRERDGCCTLSKNPADEFLQALKDCFRNVRYKSVSRKIFGADFMEWYEANNTSNVAVGQVRLRRDSRFRDVFLQFLFRAVPMIEVNLLDPVKDPAGNQVYQVSTIFQVSMWHMTPELDDIVRLMRETGVEGEVQYTYPYSLAPHPIPLNCSKMIHAMKDNRMPKYMNVTNIPELFASDDCGFNGRKDIVVRAIGVLDKNVSFYDFLFNLIVSMPPITCMFQMKFDDGWNPEGSDATIEIDFRHNRIFPLYHTNDPFSSMTGSEAMNPILVRLGEELPHHHQPPPALAFGGAVGNWSRILFENGIQGSGSYFLKLACSGDVFSVGKGLM